MPAPDHTLARRAFTTVAVVEAVTWTGLLVGMFLKYVTETTEAGVWLFGRLHGAAFLAYCVTTLVVARALRWSWVVTLLALAASVPPLTTLLFEVVARRRGLLGATPARAAADPRSSVSTPA